MRPCTAPFSSWRSCFCTLPYPYLRNTAVATAQRVVMAEDLPPTVVLAVAVTHSAEHAQAPDLVAIPIRPVPSPDNRSPDVPTPAVRSIARSPRAATAVQAQVCESALTATVSATIATAILAAAMAIPGATTQESILTGGGIPVPRTIRTSRIRSVWRKR